MPVLKSVLSTQLTSPISQIYTTGYGVLRACPRRFRRPLPLHVLLFPSSLDTELNAYQPNRQRNKTHYNTKTQQTVSLDTELNFLELQMRLSWPAVTFSARILLFRFALPLVRI